MIAIEHAGRQIHLSVVEFHFTEAESCVVSRRNAALPPAPAPSSSTPPCQILFTSIPFYINNVSRVFSVVDANRAFFLSQNCHAKFRKFSLRNCQILELYTWIPITVPVCFPSIALSFFSSFYNFDVFLPSMLLLYALCCLLLCAFRRMFVQKRKRVNHNRNPLSLVGKVEQS